MAKPAIRIRARLKKDVVSVKALITHPMETGRRKNDNGELIPAHFIQKVFAEYKGKRVFEAYWGTGVSANPFVAFEFSGASKGDSVRLSWVDNLGNSGGTDAVIQ